MSEKVVNSHLQYFYKYLPFREGNFTKDSLYGFLFFTTVENRLRMGYAKRVLRNILSYARRYLIENPVTGDGTDGDGRLTVPLSSTNDNRRPSTLEIQLTPASVAFFKDNPRGVVVQAKRFYQLMNSIGNQTNNERLKNVVCEARKPRELVFSDDQNAALLRFVVSTLDVLADKYSKRSDRILRYDRSVAVFVRPSPAVNTDRLQVTAERTVFEFCVAFLLGLVTGARIKSTVMRLSVYEIDSLIRGETLEKFTKGSFVRVFVPAQFTRCNTTIQSNDDNGSIGRLLYELVAIRRNRLLYDGLDSNLFFTCTARQLDYTFDRIYTTLFAQTRPKGVFWHSQRRRYLNSVNEKCGTVTASKSVGHAAVETTMMYINKSMHSDDTNRRAGAAIYEEVARLFDN